MYQIVLINMPFAALEFPSLALTQLKERTQAVLGERTRVKILYANQEFAHLPDYLLYQEIASSVRHGMTGLGDWIFRQAAFPEQPDNLKEFFARCYPGRDESTIRLQENVLHLRNQVDCWLDNLIERNALHQADLVGLTSMFTQTVACLALARRLKERNPALTIVMGGANCEYPMGYELVRRIPFIDFVFSGPALSTFPEFVRNRIDGKDDACHRIDGVFSRQNVIAESDSVAGFVGEHFAHPVVGRSGTELNINEPVPLDYDDFLESIATWSQIRPTLLFETSRGCWWGERAHCTFCGLNGLTMKYRSKSADVAISQFGSLFRYAGRLPYLRLQCVDNIMPREYVKEVLPYLDVPENVELFYEVKADLSRSDLAILSAARVRSIQPGIESLATTTLQLMKKGTTAFHGISLLINCLHCDITPEWNLLMGFPGETAAVYEKYLHDLPLLFHLPPPTGVFPVRFDRYSPYFSEAIAYGLDLHPYDFYQLIYPFEPAVLQQLACFFIDNNFNAEYFVKMVEWIGPISALVSQWQRRYSGADAGDRAVLRFASTASGAKIVDTRDGLRREYCIDLPARQILEALQRPLSRERLAHVISDGSFQTLDEELDDLYRRRLIFEEHGRMLSLVIATDQNP